MQEEIKNPEVLSAEIKEEPKWYILKTKPGKEAIVVDALTKKMSNAVIAKNLFAVKIIEEETMNNKKEVVIKNKFPNHVYIKMINSKEMWYEITTTEGAYCFLGPQGRPQALAKGEIRKVGLELEKVSLSDLQIGDEIEICRGSFRGERTTIKSINEANNTVLVEIYLLNQKNDVNIKIEDIVKLK